MLSTNFMRFRPAYSYGPARTTSVISNLQHPPFESESTVNFVGAWNNYSFHWRQFGLFSNRLPISDAAPPPPPSDAFVGRPFSTVHPSRKPLHWLTDWTLSSVRCEPIIWNNEHNRFVVTLHGPNEINDRHIWMGAKGKRTFEWPRVALQMGARRR